MNRIPVIDMPATGINITRMRVNAGLTVKDLQDIFGFSTPQAIYKWQRGTALPTVDNLVILAAIFGVKIDDILIFQDCGVILIPA
jgi:transcriptional regulator with XRE-family HTH domain